VCDSIVVDRQFNLYRLAPITAVLIRDLVAVAKAAAEVFALCRWKMRAPEILVPLRIGWGFAGPRYARFASFVASPAAVLRYLRLLAKGRAPRYLSRDS